ncbi:neurochondrin homolog [Neocloeon triangulifer]|uniref:neurochondrin homolog n=1 Tax=Neocloeon triangulifer TaxID=2078957 RepID=UPI00286F19D4|nr:neurochondrin homolog [Neocloeon triangulifer]
MSVKKCCAVLKGAQNDTEKFAGLFMVTKVIKAKELSADNKKQLFEAIGFDFLRRLLLTSDALEDCPPQIYKSVAVSVLSCFCDEPEVATHPQMLDNLSTLIEIIQLEDDEEENLQVISETYECLKHVALHDSGLEKLKEIGAIQKFAQAYADQNFESDEALGIVCRLASRFGPSAWGDDGQALNTLLNKISMDMETDSSEHKFELAEILHTLLYNSNRQILRDTAKEQSWPSGCYKSLSDILTSRIGKQQRDPSLKLASMIIELLGVEWALTDEEKPKAFFLLLVQLCSIEVRMQVEDRTFEQVMKNADLLVACFNLMEIAIAYVATTPTFELEQKEKQQLYTALKGAFAALIGLLQKLMTMKDKLGPTERAFVYASIRVLAAWLAQETSALRQAVHQLLPFILELANETFRATAQRKAENLEASSTDVDVLRLFLPALCHLTVEEPARQAMLKMKQDEVLFDCLQYYWLLVQPEKPVIPRADRLKQRVEVVLTPAQLEEIDDARSAMVSLCNIFMNITVLEPKLVDQSATFNQLLKFLFNKLPELKSSPENLVLQGNLAVMGLLLLKQLSARQSKNDYTICRYLTATMRFLWDAYVVEEHGDNSLGPLTVSTIYKKYWMELMELWFLGMQTMSAVLVLIPWVSQFAIESGWVEGIMDTLKRVRVGDFPGNTRSAFEDFLCHLVEASPSVATMLKDKDALQVCRNHRLMELGKKLFGD